MADDAVDGEDGTDPEDGFLVEAEADEDGVCEVVIDGHAVPAAAYDAIREAAWDEYVRNDRHRAVDRRIPKVADALARLLALQTAAKRAPLDLGEAIDAEIDQTLLVGLRTLKKLLRLAGRPPGWTGPPDKE